jgi:hypothetical protein
MNGKKRITRMLSITAILISIVFSSIYFNFNPFASNLSSNKDNNPIISPKLSVMGEHPWWNSDWPYRTLINITNLAGVDLNNYGVSVVLPYGDVEYQGKLNDELQDVRIIEYINNQPVEREFYIFQDFDGQDYSLDEATIYFNVNLTASSNPDTDTYIYYGNMDVESTAVVYGLGIIKNGNFEYVPTGDDPTGNPSIAPHYYNPVGWNWSDDVPDDIAPFGSYVGDDNNKEDQATEWWQNCLIDTPGGRTQVRGTYTYKWGSNRTSINSNEDPDDQYAGVLYTNPFTVPIVNDGAGSIYLELWQNVEAWGFDSTTNVNKPINDGYFIRVINASKNIFVDPDQHQQLGNYLEFYRINRSLLL